MYSRLSSRLVASLETAAVLLDKVDSFARSFSVAACRAGSCDRTKSVFVVKELFWPTRSMVAAGPEVRKDRFGSVGVADVAGTFESVLTADSCAVESTAFNCAITASFCSDSFCSACCSLRVSRSFLRCMLIDSGVGVLSWLENDRFCENINQYLQNLIAMRHLSKFIEHTS